MPSYKNRNLHNIIWTATNRGLIEINPVQETYKYFRGLGGLPTDVTHSILPSLFICKCSNI